MSAFACCCVCGDEKPADRQPRGCTDLACFCLFTLCCVAQGALLSYGFQNGDPSRYLSLPNYRGEFCGVSAYVADKPYLYFCTDGVGRLNWTSPICVAECPDPAGGAPGQVECPFGMSTEYPTEVFLGELCVPKDRTKIHELTGWLWTRPVVDYLLEISEIVRAWQVLAIAGVVSIMLAFCYLFFLEHATFLLFWCGIVVVVSVPALIGGWSIYVSQIDGADHLPSTGDSTYDLLAGCGLIVLSCVLLCIACFMVDSVSLAIECIKATCECIRDMPTLLFEPIIALCFKAPLLGLLIAGFLYLSSCVDEIQEIVWTDTGLVTIIDLAYKPDLYWFLGFYACTAVWIMGVFSALSHFAVAYATQMWWFSHHRAEFGLERGAPTCAACRGLVVGLFYHVGTFAFGAFVIGTTGWLRFILTLIIPSSGIKGNPLTDCILGVCTCCVACFERFLRFLTKNAYIDVAVYGSDFCKAAHNSWLTLCDEAIAVVLLNGATWLFQLTGLGGIAAGGAYVTFLMVTHIYVYADTESLFFVEDPIFFAAVSFVINFVVALPFMIVFDQVSDTILFCYASEELRQRKAGGVAFAGGAVAVGVAGGDRRPEMQALLRPRRQ
mmetsp:Transcript_18371/g.52619  ORF Transcript_18371/g.52619 Transcript_18371/m.52619 type:complete len:609 (-) Transcript_18371:185-2011(-)